METNQQRRKRKRKLIFWTCWRMDRTGGTACSWKHWASTESTLKKEVTSWTWSKRKAKFELGVFKLFTMIRKPNLSQLSILKNEEDQRLKDSSTTKKSDISFTTWSYMLRSLCSCKSYSTLSPPPFRISFTNGLLLPTLNSSPNYSITLKAYKQFFISFGSSVRRFSM